jgi:hypothetical protein
MNNEQLHRDLGRVEGTVSAVAAKVDRIEAKLDAALAHIERQKGARRATIAIASGIATLVGFLAGLIGTYIK